MVESKQQEYYHAIAIISDIHANLEALSAVLEDIENMGASVIYCLGDLVGYGPDPKPVIRKMMDLQKSGKLFILLAGNHDFGIVNQDFRAFSSGAKLSNEWTIQQLVGSPEMEFMNTLVRETPSSRELGKFIFVHSTLQPEPTQWNYLQSKNAVDNFVERKIVFVGHSHFPAIYSKYSSGKNWMPLDLLINAGFYYLVPPLPIPMVSRKVYRQYRLQIPDSFPTMIVNVGSVGQPRDNNPHARYLIYKTEGYKNFLEYRQVGYDVEKTVQKLHARNLPCDITLATRLCTGGASKFDDRLLKPSWFPSFELKEAKQTLTRLNVLKEIPQQKVKDVFSSEANVVPSKEAVKKIETRTFLPTELPRLPPISSSSEDTLPPPPP